MKMCIRDRGTGEDAGIRIVAEPAMRSFSLARMALAATEETEGDVYKRQGMVEVAGAAGTAEIAGAAGTTETADAAAAAVELSLIHI